MRTEYSGRYIVLGLKIAYYRKKAVFTKDVFAETNPPSGGNNIILIELSDPKRIRQLFFPAVPGFDYWAIMLYNYFIKKMGRGRSWGKWRT